jgi:hypothetical protein
MWKTALSLFPLPVELTDFSGTLQGKNALLKWTTSAEYNSKQFELEKSLDGISFRRIATVPAAGNSNSPLQYSYTDKERLTENNFYRLKIVDIDNQSKLSNTVLIKLAGAEQEMQLLGNPFRNTITVRFVKAPETNGELRLADMSGRLVARKVIAKGEQMVQLTVPDGAIAAGTYILQATINKQRYTAKVMKQ